MVFSIIRRVIIFCALIAITPLVQAQCVFDIRPSAVSENCYYAISQVVWTDLVNTTVSGQELRKTSGGNGNWNAAAFSTFPVYDEGYAETTIQETNRDRMFGLSDTNTGSGFNGIDFAFFFRSNGGLRIYENGNNRGDFGSYSTNDVFRIEVDNGVVKYYQNGTLLYVSNNTPSLPLYADVSINDENGTIDNALIANPFDGNFSTFINNAGTGPSYTWYRNGVADGSAATYSPATLNDGDVIYATVLPGAGGCSGTLQTSNEITVRLQDISQFGSFYISADAEEQACKVAAEPAVFSSIVNLFVTGNDLVKRQGGNGNWNAAASSLNTVSDNGYMEFVATEDAYDKMLGLSNDLGGDGFNSIDHAFYLRSNDDLRIYENGSDRGDFGSYTTGDVFRIAAEDGVIRYYHNGILLYQSNDTPTFPLYVDGSFNDEGAAVSDVMLYNGSDGSFTANATNAGTSPAYQWQLNGADLPGETSSTLSYPSIADGDVITCVITPDLAGCASQPVTSAPVTISEFPEPAFGTFFVENTAATSACKEAIEQVTFTGITNIFVTGNDIIKGQGGNGNWNAGAYSLNTVKDNGYLEFTAPEDAYDKMIGISSDAGGNGFGSIDFAFFLRSNDGPDL